MSAYKVLVVHSCYQLRGGEDAVVSAEIEMLRDHGHEVKTYFRNNHDIERIPAVSLAIQTLWSSRTIKDLIELIDSFKPDIIHVHNTFPLISSSIYWAAAKAKVPVVQTLHNFRLMCLSALYLRQGQVCEDCVGHVPWRGVVHSCYRQSTAASAVLAGTIIFHRALGTYRNKVSRYIVLNKFCRDKFVEGGLPEKLIVVKPNFVDATNSLNLDRQGILFVGRLSTEKGIHTLVNAIMSLPDMQLKIAGSGPMSDIFIGLEGVKSLGQLSKNEVQIEMSRSIAVVLPSIWYETFGMVIIEAFSRSTPVIVSRIGALAELVIEGETGLLFESGNSDDLANKISWALSHPKEMAEMGIKARAKYEAEFTADRNYIQLIEIYKGVLLDHSDIS